MNLHHHMARELVAERQHALREDARSAGLARLARSVRRARRAGRRRPAERDVGAGGERHLPAELGPRTGSGAGRTTGDTTPDGPQPGTSGPVVTGDPADRSEPGTRAAA